MRYNARQDPYSLVNLSIQHGYREGVDSVANYIGCLHPETTLEDILKSIDDAIEKEII